MRVMATTTTESLARSERFSLRLRPHEMAALRRVASQEQMRLSEFVRGVLLDAAQRRLVRGSASRKR